MGLRILHLILAPRMSGAETLVLGLINQHVQNGHGTAVAALKPSEPSFLGEIKRTQALGVEWFVPEAPLKGLDRLRQIARAVAAFQPDVVIAHSVIPSAYARVALLPSKVPVISVLHASGDNYAAPVWRLAEKVLSRKAAAIVTIAPEVERNYRARFSNPNVIHIPNGIDVAALAPDRQQRHVKRRELGISEQQQMILQVGRIDRLKQQGATINAFNTYIKRSGDDAHLLLVGGVEDSGFQDELEHQVNALGLQHQVHFLGARADVPALLSSADLYVMPSRVEAQGIALLEALASGVEVVASDIEAFAFARYMPGVMLVDPLNTAEYAAALRGSSIGARFNRDVSEFSIRRAAQAYEVLAAGYVL